MITRRYKVHAAAKAMVTEEKVIDGEAVAIQRQRARLELVPADNDGTGTIIVILPLNDVSDALVARGEVDVTFAPAAAG